MNGSTLTLGLAAGLATLAVTRPEGRGSLARRDPHVKLECLCADDFGAGKVPVQRRTKVEKEHVQNYEDTRDRHQTLAKLATERGVSHYVADSDDRDSRHSDAYLYFQLSDLPKIVQLLDDARVPGDILDVPVDLPTATEKKIREAVSWTIERTMPRERGSRATALKIQSQDARQTATTRFFDALEAEAGENQVSYFGPFTIVGDRTGGVYGNLEIGVTGSQWSEREHVVHLGFVGVQREQRRQGRGRRLMRIVTAAADRAGLPIELDVDPTTMHGDTRAPVSKKDLRTFYASLGFHAVRGMGPDFMRRDVS